MAKMLNATNSWFAFDTSAVVGGIYYKYYFKKAIQAPESLPITALRHIGWVTIEGIHKIAHTLNNNTSLRRQRCFLDLYNNIYSPANKKYLTILQAGIMIDPTLALQLHLTHELMEGFPKLPSTLPQSKYPTIDGEPCLQALGRYTYILSIPTQTNIIISTYN